VKEDKELQQKRTRPSWDEYFMQLAVLTATRSPDSQTQVGCVLVHKKRIISAGYNGFCSGIDDSDLPRTRPEKYPYMVHAEQNAISNMIIKPKKNIVAYVTHVPCCRCAKLLWQNNIRHWKILSGQQAFGHSEEDKMIQNLLFDSGLRLDWIELGLT
tara:strand:- start:167 stop:637 length:471 start_codon:yes stop_codon:yes gene_type:complete